MPLLRDRAGGVGHAGRVRAGGWGRAVQVEPMKTVLKAPGSKILKLREDEPLSNFAFNFYLRRYTGAVDGGNIFLLSMAWLPYGASVTGQGGSS